MKVSEIINLLRDYYAEDEVVGVTQKGRVLIFDEIDTQATTNTGRIVIRTEWETKNPEEHLPEAEREDITPEEEHPHYARVVTWNKNVALKQFPWTVATVRMVDGWMCFDSEREKARWLRQNKTNLEVNANAPKEKKFGYRDPDKPRYGKRGRPKKNTL